MAEWSPIMAVPRVRLFLAYNDIKSWWLVGGMLTLLTFIVHITLGVWWWSMLINWNML